MKINPSEEGKKLDDIGPLEAPLLDEDWKSVRRILAVERTKIFVTSEDYLTLHILSGFGIVELRVMELKQ
jgi:hypothetical protein